MSHVEFFKQQVGLGFQRGERGPMLEVHADGGEALLEAADDTEDKRAISDGMSSPKLPRASAMNLNLRQ
jgi:hypothetical protein